MWTQLIVLAFFSLARTASGYRIFGINFESLHVTYSQNIDDGYFRLPLSVYEITKRKTSNFILVGRDEEIRCDIYCQPDDPRLCLLYDSFGIIAGIQIGFIEKDITAKAQAKNIPFNYNYSDIPIFDEQTLFGQNIYSVKVLFLCPNKLKAGGRWALRGPVEEGIFAKLDGFYAKIPTDECAAQKLGFTKQGCTRGIGQHYYYQLSPTTDCKSFQPIFLLYEFGELSGFGLTPFGSYTSKPGGRKWFEDIPDTVSENIVLSGPTCLNQWSADYGMSTIHVFFSLFPITTGCPPKGFEKKCPTA